MFGIRAVLLLSLVINVLVNGYQDDEHLDGELEVLLKRLQGRLEDEERGYELEDLFERWGNMYGIETAPEVAAMYQDMKLNGIYKWVTFKIEGGRIIVSDKSAAPSDGKDDKTQFDEMKEQLTSGPRYILYDFKFESTTGGRQINKIAFIFWLDESNAGFRDMMNYSSSKDTIKNDFAGLSVEFLANEKGDLVYETIRDDVERKA